MPLNQTSEYVLAHLRGQINSLGLSAVAAASGTVLNPNNAHQQKTFAPHFLCIRYTYFTHKKCAAKFSAVLSVMCEQGLS
jgi:hypothetical protein